MKKDNTSTPVIKTDTRIKNKQHFHDNKEEFDAAIRASATAFLKSQDKQIKKQT